MSNLVDKEEIYSLPDLRKVSTKSGAVVFLSPLPKEWYSPYIIPMYETCVSMLENGIPVVKMAVELVSRAIAIEGVKKKKKTGAQSKPEDAMFSKRGVDEVTEAVYKAMLLTPIPITVTTKNFTHYSDGLEEVVAEGAKSKVRRLIKGTLVFSCPIDDSTFEAEFIAEALDPRSTGFSTVIAIAYFIREVFEIVFKIPVDSIEKIKESIVEDDGMTQLLDYLESLSGIEKQAANELVAKLLSNTGIKSISAFTDDQAKTSVVWVKDRISEKVHQLQRSPSLSEGTEPIATNPQ